MPDGTNVIKKGRKYAQVLQGAREVFRNDGFEGASVDNIARAAGVSKATLYSYFTDKRQLFSEVVRIECKQQAETVLAKLDVGASIRDVLPKLGREMVAFYSSDFGQGVYKVCVAESDRFPGLGQEFYESGPQMVCDQVSQLLEKAIERGELRIDDVPLAAEQFGELCKATLFNRRLFNVTKDITPQARDRVVDSAVAMFLSHYAT